MHPVVGVAINPTTMDTNKDKGSEWEDRPTYEEYPLTGARKTFCGVATFLIYFAGIGVTIYLYSVLTSWEWFTNLYIFNIFIFVAILPLPMLLSHSCAVRMRRWFVWTEIGRRRAEKRGFF